MNRFKYSLRGTMAALAIGCLAVGPALPAAAAPSAAERVEPLTLAGTQLEDLDRGLVAVAVEDQVFLNWRLLASETRGASANGMTGAGFVVYRDGEPIAAVDDSTNYADPDGTEDSSYAVAPVVNGVELAPGPETTVWGEGFHDLPLRKPVDGVTPAGEAFTYAANDVSVGDVTGDGAYEYVVKWDPSNSKDVSQKGYTGNTYLDTYTLDGTLLNRIDLGVNIRSGAHYTQFLVQDFDGDGRSEIMVKTAPGTSTTAYDDGVAGTTSHITLPAADVDAGVSHGDDYRMSAADYREHLISMFAGWDEHPEVAAGNWPATIEDALGIEPRHDYPLTEGAATDLADYFIDEYAPSRSERNDLTTFEGFVVSGPEYLSVFDGESGAELDTVDYDPGRGDDGLLWGDYAMSRIEPGNRVDRFLATTAYLDGEKPSAVFARGYYTRTALAAYDFDGQRLTQRWIADSGHVPMDNPFDAAPHGGDGSDPVFGEIASQGFHSMMPADLDGDGRQEIFYGGAALDDDGSVLYSTTDVLPEGSAAPGETAKLGHGDAMHVGDLDPDRDGLEAWTVHEGGAWAPYGSVMRDAATGEVLFGAYSGRDTGRGMVGDVDPEVPGLEAWASMPDGTDASGLLSVKGERLGAATPGTNASIRWAADGTTQIVGRDGANQPMIEDWKHGTLLTGEGARTNNGTKGNPSLVADVLGDWREELLVPTADSSALRFYLSTEVTGHKLPTLMHDPQYRSQVSAQQTSYNQPAYPGFYLASDIDYDAVPILTRSAVPAAPRALDRPGDARDEVKVKASDPAFTYYVDGEEVTARNGKAVFVGDAVVVAVPNPGYRVEAGAQTRWEVRSAR
ncbi:rhamnogalacturonan lyase [Zhihengliuella halotolerans]|uniref:rhamnogalacturonan lyase n=1 Tax=Zhihengliuella halotolerans TaxID=370736 RepID=UPI000C801709|nr:rhamnogalacturonan lyase [Zhihengliuella halotolerans]